MVSISACHAEGPGSIPGRGVLLVELVHCERIYMPERQRPHTTESNMRWAKRTQCGMHFARARAIQFGVDMLQALLDTQHAIGH